MKGEKSGNVTNDGLSQDVIYSISGGKNELWIGRQQGGLTRLRYNGDAFTAKTYTRKDGLSENSVYAVHEDKDGTVWAGTLSGGLSEFRDGHFTTYTTAQGLTSNTISAIAEGSDDTVWFATPTGLNAKLKSGTWAFFKASDGLPSENVNCLLAEPGGVLWIGTASGLAYLSAGKIQVPREEPDALHEQILGIAQDKHGWLWISTSNHVLRVKRDKLLSGAASEADTREFGLEDGLQGTEGVKRFQSVFVDGAGEIWFSMNRGISVVDPSRMTGGSPPTLVHIESISVDGMPMGAQSLLRLPGPSRRVTFTYAGLNLSVPERIRFRYKLDGIDENWSEPVTTREATYNSLGAGSYRFRVMANNSDGLWSSSESTVQFEIAKAYWQTWWFRIAAAATGALVILLFFRLRVRTLSAQMNMRFDERLAERTRIAQELHDTLLQGFLSASMQLHVADDLLPANSPAKPLVGRVLSLMTRVIEDGRNTLRGLRSSETTPENLEEAFSRIQHEFAISNQAGFRILVEGTPRQLRSAIRDDLYFIGREALTNAFRHSAATRIEIELEYQASHLRVLVRDNGRGIDQQVLTAGRDGHWGLSGMRERAERIGAKLSVLSRHASGTEVELSVPSRIAFAPETSKSRPGWIFWTSRQGSGTEKSKGKNGQQE
jgi:signal transduction histidine kinase